MTIQTFLLNVIMAIITLCYILLMILAPFFDLNVKYKRKKHQPFNLKRGDLVERLDDGGVMIVRKLSDGTTLVESRNSIEDLVSSKE